MRIRKWMPLLSAVLVMSCLTACQSSDNIETTTKIAFCSGSVSVEGAAISTDPDEAVYLSRDKEEEGATNESDGIDVVNITSPGTYRIFGTLDNGRVQVDLGEDAVRDPQAVVTLILANAHITCNSAAGIIFNNVYAPSGKDKDGSSSSGANIVLAAGSRNTVKGAGGGAITSRTTLNLSAQSESDGTLDITGEKAGIYVHHRLAVNGGRIHIRAKESGIRIGEKNVALATVNDGDLRIVAGIDREGSGIESDGRLVINGGSVVAATRSAAGSGLRSRNGTYINGGTVVALGSKMDSPAEDSRQVVMNLRFDGGGVKEPIVLTDEAKNAVFAYDPSVDATLGGDFHCCTGAVISSASLAEDGLYHLFLGGTLNGNGEDGLYDGEAITDYIGGRQQVFTAEETKGDGDNVDEETTSSGITPSGGGGRFSETGALPQFTDFCLNSRVNVFYGVTNK